jgi:hypothetical protein
LSFRARAPSVECSVADEATYLTSRRLRTCQLAVGAGVSQGKLTGRLLGVIALCSVLERRISPNKTRHHAPRTLAEEIETQRGEENRGR